MSPVTKTHKTQDLAKRLVLVKTKAERVDLLNKFEHDAVSLAESLRDLCYEKWTSEPTVARRAALVAEELCKRSDDLKIHAIGHWIKGISDITRGKLESAVESLDQSTRSYKKLRDDLGSAQPLVAKLIALAMLGEYDEAVAAGKRALAVFERSGDELAAGKVELNLSNIAARRERHTAAKKLAVSALSRFERIGEKTWQTMAENDLANTYGELCELELAEHYYRKAIGNAEAAGMTVTCAEIEASLGDLARSSGRYDEALRRLERSRETYEQLSMPHQTAIADLEIADMYGELNLYKEAGEAYERLIKELRKLKLRSEEGRARTNFGLVLIRTGKAAAAKRQLNAALRLYVKEDNVAAQAKVLMQLASIALSEKDLDAAEKSVRSALKNLKIAVSPRRELHAKLLLARIKHASGRKKNAAADLTDLLARSEALSDPRTGIAALTSLASIAAESGDDAKAEALFLDAIESIEALREPLPGEEFRRSYIADKLEPVEQLTALYLRRDRLEDAFVTLERGRARSLHEMVAANTSAPKDSAADRRIARLREKLNWLYSRRETATADAAGTEQIAIIERQLSDLRRREQSKTRTAKRGFSRFSKKDLDAFRRTLGSDRAYIEYFVECESFSALVATDSELHYLPSLIAIDSAGEIFGDLHFGFSGARVNLAAGGPFAAMLKRKTDAILGRAFRGLIEPTLEIIGSRNLLISPSGILNFLPFAAFFDGERYLIGSREVVYTPSAAIAFTLGRRRKRRLQPTVLAGFADERIPLVEKEIAAIQKLSRGKVETFQGNEATFARFVEAAPRAGTLHVACHGVYRPDNPMFSSLHFADGWVTAGDIMEMNLRGELVTLSACETGVSSVDPGEETVGLARGFLSAGASNVLLTLWTVNDVAAQEVMSHFYRGIQRGSTLRASLRSAQLKFAERDENPYFWAPFILVGS